MCRFSQAKQKAEQDAKRKEYAEKLAASKASKPYTARAAPAAAQGDDPRKMPAFGFAELKQRMALRA